MARKPNYDFEKRRKEAERKAKKEEKAARKRDNLARGIVDPDDYVDAFAPVVERPAGDDDADSAPTTGAEDATGSTPGA